MSKPNTKSNEQEWADAWIENVANGFNTMSQRKLTSIETRSGGMEAVRRIAEAKGVHVLLLEDDNGDQLVAASLKPFTVVC